MPIVKIKKLRLRETKLPKIFILIFSMAMIVISLIGDKGLLDLKRLQAKEQDLLQEIELLEQQKAEWIDKVQSMKENQSYIETVARVKLGLVKSNELIFQLEFPDGEKTKMDER